MVRMARKDGKMERWKDGKWERRRGVVGKKFRLVGIDNRHKSNRKEGGTVGW